MRQRLTWKKTADLDRADFILAQRPLDEAMDVLKDLMAAASKTATGVAGVAKMAEFESAGIEFDMDALIRMAKGLKAQSTKVDEAIGETLDSLVRLRREV